jgi:hypothetical protein
MPLLFSAVGSPLDEGCAMSHAVSRRPPTAEAQVLSQAVRVVSVVDKVALRLVSLRVLQ